MLVQDLSKPEFDIQKKHPLLKTFVDLNGKAIKILCGLHQIPFHISQSSKKMTLELDCDVHSLRLQ